VTYLLISTCARACSTRVRVHFSPVQLLKQVTYLCDVSTYQFVRACLHFSDVSTCQPVRACTRAFSARARIQFSDVPLHRSDVSTCERVSTCVRVCSLSTCTLSYDILLPSTCRIYTATTYSTKKNLDGLRQLAKKKHTNKKTFLLASSLHCFLRTSSLHSSTSCQPAVGTR
jgi:hypothetical protein